MGIVHASAVVILIHGLENVNGVCCVLLVPLKVDEHNRPSFRLQAREIAAVIEGCRRCRLAATRVGVARTLFLHLVTTCGSFVVGYFRSTTLNDAPSEMTASMGSLITCSFLHEYS